MRRAIALWLLLVPALASAQDEPIPGGTAPPAVAPSPAPVPPPTAAPAKAPPDSAAAAPGPADDAPGDLALAASRTARVITHPDGMGSLRPTLKLGLRTFKTKDDDVDRQQPWRVAVLEVYPWSDMARIGLVTQVAVESPAAGRDTTDFFMTEGLQIAIARPTRWITPFASAHVAVGFMRRLGEVMNTAVPSYSALASVGADAGFDVRVFKGMCLGLTVGVVHPIERRYGVDPDTRQVFSSTFTSTAFTVAGYVGW